MNEWMDIIAKRELNEDDIIKIKFLSRESKAAKKERERRTEQMKETQAAQKQRKVAEVPSMVNLNEEGKRQLNLPKVPNSAPNLPSNFNIPNQPNERILADVGKESEEIGRLRMEERRKKQQQTKEAKQAQESQLQQNIAEGAKMATQMKQNTARKKKQDAIRQLNAKIQQEQQMVPQGNPSEIQQQRQDKQKNIQALQNKLKEIRAIQV